MDKIKTEQPYKLYKKVFRERTNAKRAIIGAILTLVLVIIFDPESGLIGIPLMLIISSPWMFYNPWLKSEYVPGASYSFFRKVVKAPPMLLNKLDRIQMQNHEDVDFNVKVDLNAVYGVNDKLVMSYQNFGYEKERMEEGDYLLGVSPQGVYFVKKNQTVTKTKINFDDIDTLGLLVGLGNVYVFHIISKHNDEINIIVDSNQSLLVSPIMLFNKMLKLLDAFIESGGAVTDSTSRRRRVSVPSSSSNSINTGASQETSNNRVIDISYSTGVLEEMKTATYVGSNRNIEIDTPVSTEVVHEESDGSRFVEVEKSEAVSNRSVDLDDIIESRIADVRRDIIIESETPPDPIIPPLPSQSETSNTENQQGEIHDPERPKKKTPSVVEIPKEEMPQEVELKEETPKEEIHETVIPKEETPKQEMPKDVFSNEEKPKEKKKTGLIIGIVAAVVVIAVLAVLFFMKGKKDDKTSEESFAVEQQDPNEAELSNLILDAYKTREIYNLETPDFQAARKAASAAEEASGSICIDWDYYYCTQDDYPDRFNVTRMDFINPNKANVYVELIFDREVSHREGNYFTDNVVLAMVRDIGAVWLVDDVWHGGNSIKQEMIECTRNIQGEIMSNTSSNVTKVYSNAYEGNQVVVIDGSELRLRLGPSTSSDTYKWPDGTNRHPKVGERFKYLGESGDFYKIDFNGNELWVSKQFTHVEEGTVEASNVANGLTNEYEWILGEWKGIEFKSDLAIITRDGIVCNNAVRSGMLDEVEPNRSELTKQTYEIKKTKYDFDNKEYMSIVVNGDSAYFRDGETAFFLDLKSKVIFYFYDFDQKITLKKVK